ncbi:MAG: efflux RND transporter permease subunit, partial [Candidatus Cryptobacteroides sp.]
MEHKGLTSRIVLGAIKYKNIVRLILALLIIAGIVGLQYMNKDEFPTFEIKQGLIAAVYPGADVYEVEREVGKPLEELLFSTQEINRGATKVVSRDGICYVYTDLNTPASKKNEVWSKIRLRLQNFKQTLPPGVLAIVAMDDFSDITSVLIAMESSDKGPAEMKEYADDLARRLRTIPTLANAKILGEQEEEIAVIVDRDRLAAYGISPSSLALDYQTSAMQMLGGKFSTGYAASPVHVKKTVNDQQELENKIVWASNEGQVLRLKDVARIERRCKEPSSLVTYNGHTALVLSIEMLPDNNIVAFGKEVDKVLADFIADAPESLKVSRITDQPKVVGDSVWSFLRDLLISMLVVILVMLLLFPMRSALIASSGVPVCTAIALACMYLFGICLNTVSLAALIVVLGMIVDDSIITMDGYMDKLGRGLSRVDAACASAQELFMPMLMATVAISAMFFPMTGIITGYLGDFVKTFPYVIAFALMASLAYAVLVVPSLEVKFITSTKSSRDNFITRMQDRLFDALQKGYDYIQGKCFRHPVLTILSGVAAIGLGLLMFSRMNIQLMPMAARPVFAVEIYLDPSADLARTTAVADSMATLLRQDRRVTSVTEFIGTGTPRFHATYSPILPGPNVAQLIVNTKSNKATESFLREMESRYEHWFPEAVVHFKQMDYQGVSSPVEVKVLGEDYGQMLIVADTIKNYMAGLDMLKWVHSDADNLVSSIAVELDEDEALRMGVNRTLMNLSLTGEMGAFPLSSIREGETVIPVNLYSENYGKGADYENIANTLVPSSIPGVSVPLRQVARLSPEWKPESLTRVDGKPVIVIGADMRFGKSQPTATRAVKKFLKGLDLPEGVSVEFGGLNNVNRTIGPEIALSFIAAVLVLFFFLVFHFKKISLAILTIVLSTLCLFGAFFGLWIFGLDFSMTAVLGLISLVGIIVRNGIIMFEYAEELRFAKGVPLKEAAEEAGKRRMRPIFLTSCTTALGVLPMIISGDLLWMPMGVVICFGTMLSVILITLIMPVSYWVIFRGRERKEDSRKDAAGVSKALVCVALLCVVPAFASAQSLSLEDCRNMALSNAAAQKNAELDVQAAIYQKQEAFAEYFPRVSASAFGYWSLNPMIEIGVSDILGKSEAAINLTNKIEDYAGLYGINTSYEAFKRGYSASVMALQPVYAGGRIVNGNRLAGLGIEAAGLQRDIQKRKTVRDVDEIWWQIASVQDKLEVLDYLDSTLDTLYSNVSAAVASGLASETDLLQLEIRKTELKAGRKQAEGGLKLLRLNLFNTIGQPFSTLRATATEERPYLEDIALECVSELPDEPQSYWRDEDEVVSGMSENRLLDIQVQARQLEKKMAIGEALPQIAVGATTGYSNLYEKGRVNLVAFATVQIPLTDWGKTSRKALRLDTQVRKAENDREYLQEQLRVQVGKLWLEMETAYDNWQIAVESESVARRLYEVALSNYTAGIVPLQDLLQAETTWRTSLST